MDKREFGLRLSGLRLKKGVSARDISLSLGQSPGYINSIENGISYPSMSVFFYICEYLDISPRDFFPDTQLPPKLKLLLEAAQELTPQQLEHLLAIAQDLSRTKS